MPRLLALSLTALVLASLPALGAPPGRIMGAQFRCTTVGDALGGLEVTAAGGTVTMVESTMEGKKITTKAPAKLEQVQSLVSGKGANFIFKTKKSNEFGGAVSDAVLLTVGDRDAKTKKREAFMARAGVVYVLGCEG